MAGFFVFHIAAYLIYIYFEINLFIIFWKSKADTKMTVPAIS